MPGYPGRGPRRFPGGVKEETKGQVRKVGAFFRDLLMGDEEPGDFLARKAREEGASPGLMADIVEVLTPNPAPERVVEAEIEVEGEARTNPGTPQAKRRSGPPPELESACHACRLARRINGGKCVEHS